MREIFIKYNPYKVETEIKIDGKAIKANSALNVDDKRLQEWIEDLPQILVDECNTKVFNIKFHGTVLDYEDLESVSKDASESGIKIKCEHIPAKEVKDKEKSIKHIFREIQSGPFEELKQPDLKRAFEMASSSEFEVNVVATMSAGKSTLINALLRKKLMPAKQEACTATITKIKDKELDVFRATAYDNNENLIETHPELSITTMDKLNNNPEVSTIKAEGNIPFVDSNDISLVLVDTPGPNNSRDPEHKAATYRMLSESSKTLVIYILNATQLAVNDDNDLLNYVSDSMRVGGKQSKDRFIFVVNKLDDFKQGEDSVTNAIDKVRKYLEDKGIKNPSIFPTAALPALDIRTSLQGIDISKVDPWDEEVDPNIVEAISKVQKLIRNEELHLEKYSNINHSVRDEINNMLEKSRTDKDKYTEALIHTGIIPIESAIKMYVDKYAKMAKIKNIVDTFSKKLESAKSFEKIKQEIINNQNKRNEILANIEIIKDKINSAEEARKFEVEINNIDLTGDVKQISTEVIEIGQGKIKSKIDEIRGHELEIKAIKSICASFEQFSKQLEADIQVKLENMISSNIQDNANTLLEIYEQKISELSNELNSSKIYIDPLELMEGDICSATSPDKLFKSLAESKKIDTGEIRTVMNPEREGFWGKLKFWKPKTIEENVFKDVEYVDGGKFATRYFASLQEHLMYRSDEAREYANEASNYIKEEFMKKFQELDEILKIKLEELESCTFDNSNAALVIEENENRLRWLEDIQCRVQNTLEI